MTVAQPPPQKTLNGISLFGQKQWQPIGRSSRQLRYNAVLCSQLVLKVIRVKKLTKTPADRELFEKPALTPYA
jgi:hypothetical protein